VIRFLLMVVSVSLLMGCADPVVGATCREGFFESEGRCVPAVDAGGVDAGLDAGVPTDGDVPMDGDVPRDGDVGRDGDVRDGASTDAGIPVCDLGEILCGDACVRPAGDPMNCGDCGVACATGELCAAGSCSTVCDPPLVRCGGLCIDVMGSDPDNCGSCGNRCGSGICIDGTCVDAMAGHVVVIGHDYARSRVGIRRVAGNGIFLAPGAPVEVLVYEGDATMQSIRGVDRAIDQVATERGRAWVRDVAMRTQFLLQLDKADVLVIYPQADTADALLTDLGTEWSVGLASFLRRGGVVVSFDGLGSNGGTYQILQAAGQFVATARTEVTGDSLSVVAPGDAVALGVPLSYMAEMSTVRFDTMESRVVVQHVDGPVVVHRVVTP